MIVRRFLRWVETASPRERAEATSALARAYVGRDFDPEEQGEAERALTWLLDDPSPLVRRALALALADAAGSPHHVVLGLADDQSDISVIVLGRSPLLSDSELIDCATTGDAFAQSAIALRPVLSASVAAALAEIGTRETLVSLAINPGADIPEFSLRRMIERFGDDGELREAILSRAMLPEALRSDLVAATASALGAFVTSCNWLSSERVARVTREACEKATMIIAATSADRGMTHLVAHLRARGLLTASLMLRSLLSGHAGLFTAALCDLAGLPPAQVAALVRAPASAAFAALCRRADLPVAVVPAFQVALSALAGSAASAGDGLSRPLVERVLAACEARNGGELDKLVAVLRRFEAEAAREDVRRPARAAAEIGQPPAGAPPAAAEPAPLLAEPVFVAPPVETIAPIPVIVDLAAIEAAMLTEAEPADAYVEPARLAA